MNEYIYVVRDESGERQQGRRKAVCQHDVLMWARDNNFTPISVEEVKTAKKAKKKKTRYVRVSSADIANFCWQLATMMEGGISITEALETIAEDMENVRFGRVIMRIGDGIGAGQSLFEKVSEYPEIFDKLFQGMIMAGESSGSMPMVLRKLAVYYENRDKLIKKVRGAMTYPIVVICFVWVVVAAMAFFVIPQFIGIFDTIGGDMPVFTEVFLAVYDAIMGNMIYIIPGLIVFGVVFVWYSKTKKGHLKLSHFVLSLPLFGKIILHAFVALFAKTLGALMDAGVSVLDALDILTVMSKNDVIRHAIGVTREGIIKGSSISFSMTSARLYPNLLLKMVKVGEESGSLPDVLEKTADYYERKVEALIDVMTKLLEPLMIIFVGGIVLVVVIAMYLPIFYLSDV